MRALTDCRKRSDISFHDLFVTILEYRRLLGNVERTGKCNMFVSARGFSLNHKVLDAPARRGLMKTTFHLWGMFQRHPTRVPRERYSSGFSA